MKWIKRAACIIAGILIFGRIADRLNYIYAADAPWERILWHHFYEDKGKIENLYLGSSHVYCDINPTLLDELNGSYNFDLASPGQLMNGTYYLLKEADKNNEISHVYVELYYMFNTKINFDEYKEPIIEQSFRNWQNTDYMRMSPNKLSYMLSIADSEKYIDICVPFSRYRSNLDNWDRIKSTIDGKNNESYAEFHYHYDFGDGNGYDEYKEKGYFYSTRVYQNADRMCFQDRILEENPIAETSENYLRKVISYCRKREIPVTLFVSPIYELQLISTENYDNYVNQIREIADEYGVELYDFNLAKAEYLPIQDVKYFRDIGHLNVDGADMYTKFFHKVVSGDASENKKYFYDSYAEKLQNTAAEVYGIYYRDVEESEQNAGQLRNMQVASNRDEGMEYRIILTPNESEQYMVQDFGANKEFTADKDEHGICTIVYRMKDMPEFVQTVEINY